MEREKVWWTVVTDCGTRRTLAVSRAKAVRNVRYRLVMDDRAYGRPRLATSRRCATSRCWTRGRMNRPGKPGH